jgi:LuxR family maltose regulon positive regulatory protein
MPAREATQQAAGERPPYAQRGASGAEPDVEATDPPRPIASEMSLCRSRSGLELVAGVSAGGRSRRPERNPRELPAALGPVRHGSLSRARLLFAAAALLLEAIAPDDPDVCVLPLEHGLGLAEPLTNSETRVLHFLPTYMGVQEIAAALYLSANTVKTHLRHLYRKLGVHSRREAVQRAQAIGLLAAKASHPTGGQPRSTGTEEWIMSYGHAERNLAMLRQLEAETRELLASLDGLDPERSAWRQEATSSGDDPLKLAGCRIAGLYGAQ